MIIIGLNFNHDGSAAIIKDGKVLAAVSSERITRRKKMRGVPPVVVDYLLRAADIRIEDIDLFVACNWYGDCTKELKSNGDVLHVPLYDAAQDGWIATWLDQPLTYELYRQIYPSEEQWGSRLSYRGIEKPLVFVNHHLAHAAYSYYMSPFNDALCVAIDVSDEFGCTNAIVDFDEGGKHYRVLKRDASFSIGYLYASICDYLGFWPSVVGAGKVMALAALGTPQKDYQKFVWPAHPFFHSSVMDVLSSLGLTLPYQYILYPQLENEGGIADPVWLSKHDWTTEKSRNLAATVQAIFEESLLSYVQKIRERTTRNSLCLSGGTMLNCVANGRIARSGLFENVFVAPASGDDGLSIGAALLISKCFVLRNNEFVRKPHAKSVMTNRDVFEGGRWYSSMDVDMAIEKHRAQLESRYVKTALIESDAELTDLVAQQIADGKIVGWFYRGSELGPRALGHRSILADPRRADMKDILNLKVKHREEFRPFAPSVLKEHAEEWFDTQGKDSPFMLISMQCKKPDLIPAVCHVDGSSRIQTVDAENNGRYYEVVKAFYEKTGVPCIVNTSFNVQGEPIVETPSDAIKCFLGTQIDVLVLENTIITK